MTRIGCSCAFLLVAALVFQDFPSCSCANFTTGTIGLPFRCDGGRELWCSKGASTVAGSGALALLSSCLALRTDPVVLRNQNTSRCDSFRTSFQFIVGSSDGTRRGAGLAFVMLNSSQFRRGHSGKFRPLLGNALHVDFDVRKPEALRDSHVGVSLATSRSRSTADETTSRRPAGMDLSGDRIFAWIDYNSSLQSLEVRIGNSSAKPSRPFLADAVDLVQVFGSNPVVYVGFSAQHGGRVGFYTVTEWRFETFPSPIAQVGNRLLASRKPALAPAPGSRTYTLAVAAGVCASLALIGAIAGCLYFKLGKPKAVLDSKFASSAGRSRVEDSNRFENEQPDFGTSVGSGVRYTYKQLSAATRHFREESKLGEGGFGTVYRGNLPAIGLPVAVKRLGHDSKQGLKEFVAEVSIISGVRHRNIVKLLGWCSERDNFMLVYELMTNGSLDTALFRPRAGAVLPWRLRFSIVRDVAEALHFLHEGRRQQIIHRDVKSSNILLDDDFNAMLGDFGLARMRDRHQAPATSRVAGTYGFIAPEVPTTGKFTDKTDVYAFGAVALEIVTGEPAFSVSSPKPERMLVDAVWQRLEEGNLLACVDRRLQCVFEPKEAEVLLYLGLLCSHPDPEVRPSMRLVLDVMAGTCPLPSVPARKPCSETNSECVEDLQSLLREATLGSRSHSIDY
ncbi:protein MpRLK-Pelle_L-LEC5 [Marchantia polymorpha subsp. ruderalis]|nr:hypothetical protein MARPO_0122s0039 [Marchantia polymorpha]BBN02558.1 hypothetical protein Mp_2g16250 [Marchantia polymorpha subsp. ruderalis]|eukprot:PTQ30611.1 hypothetical protein MARPO_0122s0039 [Marchantia polymorpha]